MSFARDVNDSVLCCLQYCWRQCLAKNCGFISETDVFISETDVLSASCRHAARLCNCNAKAIVCRGEVSMLRLSTILSAGQRQNPWLLLVVVLVAGVCGGADAQCAAGAVDLDRPPAGTNCSCGRRTLTRIHHTRTHQHL